jgi:hypothetical protein
LTLSIVLVAWTSLGVLGVVIGTIAVNLIRRPMLVIYAARVCGFSAKTYAMRAYARPGIVLVILIVLAAAWRWLGLAESLEGLLGGATAATAAWLPSVWWLGLTADDRKYIRSLFGDHERN